MPDRGAIPLSAGDLAISAALVVVAGVVSVALGLRLERRLAWASVRTVVQLLLVGYVLKWVFALDTAPAVLGIIGVMLAVATRAAIERSSRTFAGVSWRAFVSLVVSGLLTSFTVTGVIIGVDPPWRAQYLIPLLGMILGNGLTGISLCLDQLLESLVERKDRIEMELALGATRWEAGREAVADAVRRGMIPLINSMLVVGLVSLPGMMTGQILEGADPAAAVKYQIVVMFMIAAATSMGCIFIALLAYQRLFNRHHQLRADLIRKRAV